MELWLIAIVALAGLGVSLVVALQGRRRLVATVAAAGLPPGADPVAGVRAQRERLERIADLESTEQDRTGFIEALPLGILTVDAGLKIVTANPAAHALTGRATGTLIGRTLIEAFLDARVDAMARTALADGLSAGETSFGGADGSKLLLRAWRAQSGGLWLVLEDVSELRRLQQIRTEFIDNLSHELRTPVTTVGLLAETLGRDSAAAGDAIPARMRDRIASIEVETGYLAQMVTELLDLSRIETGGGLGVLESVDVRQAAQASIERLGLFADRQGVTLRVESAGTVPPVQADPARVAQVFVNLLHNAVKFSPEGSTVLVSVRAVGDHVTVAVEDHGVGIPRAAQARIFERFYKVDRARGRGETGGTGLGLAIARHIVEQHHGRIWVASSEGMGSTFRFSLPILPVGAPSPPIGAPSPPDAPPPPPST